MAEEFHDTAGKLQKLAERVRQGLAADAAQRELSTKTVRDAVRAQWNKEQEEKKSSDRNPPPPERGREPEQER